MGHALKMASEAATGTPGSRVRLTPAMQWALLLLAGGLIWAFWPGTAADRYRTSAPRVEHDGFLAVSYLGVGDEAGESPLRITAERLQEHLSAVTRAGYCPITIEDARAFLVDGVPLPRQPLLIIFEDGRRKTVREVDALLRAHDVPATLVVHMDAVDRKSFNYPLWRLLRSLDRTGRWSFAARPGPDLSAAMAGIRESWLDAPLSAGTDGLADGSRSQALAAESTRFVRAVGETAARLGDRLDRRNALALVLPAPLRGIANEAAAERMRKAVGEHFALAFAVDSHAFNHRNRPASELSLLRIDPAWTGQELVRRLDARSPRRTPLRQPSEIDWIDVHGEIECDATCIRLVPREQRAAEAWLAGTEAWRCLSGRVTLETRADTQSWLLLRSGPGRDFLRLGWTGTRVELQARVRPDGLRRLASVAVAAPSGRAEIDFRLLDRRLRLSVRGAEIGPRTYAVPREFDHGMVGLSSWSLRGTPGPVTIEGLQLVPRLARATIRSSIEQLRADRDETPDVLAPTWYHLQPSEHGPQVAGEEDPAFVLAAAHRGSSVWPLLPLSRHLPESAAASFRAELVRVRARSRVDGFLLDLRGATTGAEPTPGFWRRLLADPPVPLGLLAPRKPAGLPANACEGFNWIAFRGEGTDAGGPRSPATAPSHKVLLLCTEGSAP